MNFRPGFPITYRPIIEHGHLPREVGGLITAVRPDGTCGLVLFPPNGSIEHVDAAAHGEAHGEFMIAGEPSAKREPRKSRNTETQPAPTGDAVVAAAAEGAAEGTAASGPAAEPGSGQAASPAEADGGAAP